MTNDQPYNTADVRMRGFARRTTVEAAWAWLDGQVQPLPMEYATLEDAAGRVLERDAVSSVDVPGFPRAMMDGCALRGSDSLGASTYNPLVLRVIGQSLPGRPFPGRVEPGEAVVIMTGAPMPEGADAVLPAEQVEWLGDMVRIQGEVPPQKNVGQRGEDIAAGATVLSTGRRLRPQDVGVLSSIGVAQVPVHGRPRVRIAITGNELVPAGSKPEGFRIADANGPMLSALVRRDGGLVTENSLVPDDPETILQAMQDDVDVVLISGGSSVGAEDHAPQLLAQHGQLAVHGVAMRPSSPAGMGRLGQRFVFLLPGNPVSCLCAYDFFAGRTVRALAGLSKEWPYRSQTRPLARKLVSQIGRVDYARVVLTPDGRIEPVAISGASILSSTTRADGFVIVPSDSEGYPPGTEVEVFLY